MQKRIKVDKPIPQRIKKAIEDKQEWIKKVQSGEITIPTSGKKRIA